MSYEYLDISGDAGIRAEGRTLEEAFESAAVGMYGLITDTARVEAKEERRVEVSGTSHEDLLVSWLNELIYIFDAFGFIGKTVRVESIRDGSLSALIKGEEFNPDRHEGNLLLKAATYHLIKVERKGEEWVLEVIFDI